MSEINVFCVYAHYKPNSDNIFYIGKGYEHRAQDKCGRNTFWIRTVKKYGGFDVRILHEKLEESTAFCLEAMYINAYGRRNQGKGPLVNLTDGGEGPSGVIVKDATRKKLRDCQSGDKHRLYGKHQKEETKQKLSDALSGEKHPNFGKKRKKETRDKIGKSRKGKIWIHNTETSERRMMNESALLPAGWVLGRGKNRSKLGPKQRENVLNARIKYYADRKALGLFHPAKGKKRA